MTSLFNDCREIGKDCCCVCGECCLGCRDAFSSPSEQPIDAYVEIALYRIPPLTQLMMRETTCDSEWSFDEPDLPQ